MNFYLHQSSECCAHTMRTAPSMAYILVIQPINYMFYSQKRRMSGRSCTTVLCTCVWCVVCASTIFFPCRYCYRWRCYFIDAAVAAAVLVAITSTTINHIVCVSISLCSHARMRLHKLWIDVLAHTRAETKKHGNLVVNNLETPYTHNHTPTVVSDVLLEF